MPCEDSGAQQEEDTLFFPGKDSANEKPCTLCLLQPSQLPFTLYKSILIPLLCRGFAHHGSFAHVAHHGYRPQIAIFY